VISDDIRLIGDVVRLIREVDGQDLRPVGILLGHHLTQVRRVLLWTSERWMRPGRSPIGQAGARNVELPAMVGMNARIIPHGR
jgi:hypothetical protein